MKILLTNNHLNRLGGSETFTYTMAKELASRGFEVHVFTPNQGVVSEQIKSFAKIVEKPDEEYDLALVNHNNCLAALKDVQARKIFTSHGIFDALEQPIEGADAYVAISEEVQKNMEKKGFNATIIHNGIDCERFCATKDVRKNLTKVLCMCQGTVAANLVKMACEQLGLEFEEVREPDHACIEIEKKMNDADLVVALGRGVYEAMACGRSVVVFDDRTYSGRCVADGIVTKENAPLMLRNNFSGRQFQLNWELENLVDELKKYNPDASMFNRAFAVENFNIKKQVDKYLSL